MDDIPMKCYWMGRDVDTLSREEAIEAVKLLGRELETTRKTFESIRRVDRMLHEAQGRFRS